MSAILFVIAIQTTGVRSMRCYLKTALVSILLCALLVSTIARAYQAEGKRGVTPEDYFAFEFISDPHISPDGQSLAFISSRPGTDGPPATESRPQLWLLSMSGGEARRVTNLKNGASSFQWSPDGTRLACLSRTGPSDNRPDSKDKSDVRHYSHISYKFNDTGWFDDKRSHIWIVDVKTSTAKQITSGDDWNDNDPQWSPDGTRIAFVSNRTGKEYDENRNVDVWVIGSDGGQITKISDHEEGDNSPRWSPDGKTIAYIGRVREEEHPKVWLAPSAGGSPSVLAARNLDLIPSDLDWAEDGKALYFQTGVKGETHLYRVDLASKELRPVTSGARAVRGVDINDKTRKMVYTSNDF